MNVFIEASNAAAAAMQTESVKRLVAVGLPKTVTAYVGQRLGSDDIRTLIATTPDSEPGLFMGRGVVAVSEFGPFNGITRLSGVYRPLVVSWTEKSLLTYFQDESSPFSCDFETMQQDSAGDGCGRLRRLGNKFITANSPLGFPTATEAACWVDLGGKMIEPQSSPAEPKDRCLAGTALKTLLAGPPLFMKTTATCSCNARATTMDSWGCDECERREDEIVGWLREEAAKRKLPFIDAAGRALVRLAVRRARKKANQ